MAKKYKKNMNMTPIMSLAVLAIFAMMVPLFSLANNNNKTRNAAAAQRQQVVIVTPTPSPAPVN